MENRFLPLPKYRPTWHSNAELLIGRRHFTSEDNLSKENVDDEDRSELDHHDADECWRKCYPSQAMAIWNLTSTSYFEMYFQTMIFGLLVYVADTISDIFNAVVYYLQGDLSWSIITATLVLIPGLVRGTYEVFRRQVVYRSENKKNFNLKSNEIFTRLNFGLDVLPSWTIPLPDNVALKVVLAPLYVLSMAFIFPFLPIVQYSKVFKLQWKLKYEGVATYEDPVGEEAVFEEAIEEMRRAVSLKAVEAFMEAAPQLFLQIYITYKRQLGSGWLELSTPITSMIFSFLSLMKTSFDLQEVDRLDHAVSAAARPIVYLTTSIIFFATIILFRSLSISVTGLFLSQNETWRGMVAVPIALIFVMNVVLRFAFQSSGALLNGSMSIVAPAKFFCSSSKSTERNTRNYMIVYTVFNTAAHAFCILTVFLLNPDFAEQDKQIHKSYMWLYFLPGITTLGFLSTVATYMHWQVSLKHLFHAAVKFPEYARLEVRLATYPSNWNQRYGSLYSPKSLAANGLFCQNTSSGYRLCCYDCGLILRNWWRKPAKFSKQDKSGGNAAEGKEHPIQLVHAASLLSYHIRYIQVAKTADKNPDRQRQAFSRTLRVKPVCEILTKFNIDFRQKETRLKSFYYLSDKGESFEDGEMTFQELTEAGYVRTSSMTAACYSCYHIIDWSDSQTRLNSPWAIHAWGVSSKRAQKSGGSDIEMQCQHLFKRLSQYEIRLKTFPKVWLSLESSLADPHSLAEAGFFCGFWQRGRAWVNCFSCRAYSFHWPTVNVVNMNQLAELARKTITEIPGMAYNNGYILGYAPREKPIVDHYLQEANCGFVQDKLRSAEQRLKTFPDNWQQINQLRVSAEEVAEAGFVYFPKREDEISMKFRPNQVALENCSKTQCLRCLMVIDWAEESRNAADITHCVERTKLLSQILQIRNREDGDGLS